jgi:four helix bundle protein
MPPASPGDVRVHLGGTFAPSSGLRDQLERAALSMSNNIAEGFERGSTSCWHFSEI